MFTRISARRGWFGRWRRGGIGTGLRRRSCGRFTNIRRRTLWSPARRLRAMDALGVDVQVLSVNSFLYFYERDAAAAGAMARECNDYVRRG